MADREAAPELRVLYANPSGGCNLRCRHCWVASGPPGQTGTRPRARNELTAGAWGGILDEAVLLGLSWVKFTGGEPLARDDFASVYEEASSRGLLTIVETNGTLQPGGLWEAWRSSPPSFVAVSLDSADESEHDGFRGVPGSWRRTMGFIEALRSAGITLQLITSLEELDMQRVRGMAELAERVGASTLSLTPVQPLGRAVGRAADRFPIEELVGFLKEVDRSFGPRVVVNAPPVFRSARRLVNLSTCPVLNLLGILPDGVISFCGIGFTRADLRMGDATVPGTLERVWKSHPLVLGLRESLLGPRSEPCGSCFFRLSCMGDCVMQNYAREGDFAAPGWVCKAAWEAGILPSSRRLLD